MIEIYDEVKQVEKILADGISAKWERDVALMVRYYKSLGEKKSDIRKKVRQMCEDSTAFEYNHFVLYKRLNRIVDNMWKKDKPLREITSIEITREVLDWFLNLENYIAPPEKLKDIKERRKVSVKTALSWGRVKYLFTLYVWTKIQENYSEKPEMHYLKGQYKYFRECANLKPSFSMAGERDVLFDLGFIDVNYSLGVKLACLDNEVFGIEITDENRVVISGDDLIHCGYWLEKQSKGYFICQCCGKEAPYNLRRNKKFCEECANKTITGAHKGQARKIKRYCIDCGREIPIMNDNDFKTKRCALCQHARNNQKKKEYKERMKNKTVKM